MILVHKYVLDVKGEQVLAMFDGATLLSIQVQSGRVMSWWLVDDTQPLGNLKIRCVGTGHGIHDVESLSHLGTVQLDGFVWHFFGEEFGG